MHHIIESQQFDRETLEELFASTDGLLEENGKPLAGKILVSLFYEPSTRTRLSFESAMLRLGGEVLTTENAGEFSSAAKGETLEDTIRIAQYYGDAIVLRHPEEGASARAASASDVPVINAGDGAGQHPTQSLLDLYTINKELGRIEGVHVALVGDLKHGRTVRSLAYLLGKYKDVSITFISPHELRIGGDIKEYLDRHEVRWEERETWDGTLDACDAVYVTRIQKERFTDPEAYERLKGHYVLTRADVKRMAEGAIVMHPLPRLDEIDTAVDAMPQAAYFRQAGYGVAVRMALLQKLLA